MCDLGIKGIILVTGTRVNVTQFRKRGSPKMDTVHKNESLLYKISNNLLKCL